MYAQGVLAQENILVEAPLIKEKFGIILNSNNPVHPTFLYESLWCLLGVLILWLFYKKCRKFDGQIALMYCAWYGLGRMFFEGLRTDSLILFANIRVSQLLAAVTFVAAVVLLIVFFIIKGRRSKLEDDDSLIIDIPTEDNEKWQ